MRASTRRLASTTTLVGSLGFLWATGFSPVQAATSDDDSSLSQRMTTLEKRVDDGMNELTRLEQSASAQVHPTGDVGRSSSRRTCSSRTSVVANAGSTASEMHSWAAGLMSPEEAEKRYEDAVFTSLLGNYELAAIEFTILVGAGDALSPTVRHDSEWYLGEMLFEMEDYTIAEEVYAGIVDTGRKHPFYADAVRRLLEIYGILGNTRCFEEYYNGYIRQDEGAGTTKDGKVAPTELINYTLAKSFYRQGDLQRAKVWFSRFGQDSLYYSRARYFLGTIMVRQNALEDAAAEFRTAASVPGVDADSREVVDLANLALGRVEYELGDYKASVTAYQKIGRESKYFADQLYEIVWTYIKQEEYEEAIRSIEIFLLAFPEHRYAARLRVYKGHLHMKQERYESASTTYEKVISEYSPIRDLVAAVEISRDQPRIFFERLVNEDALVILNRSGLPPYAAEMLYDQDNVRQTVELRRELESQKLELQRAKVGIDELKASLDSGVPNLGAFRGARDSVRRIVNDRMEAIDALLAMEEDYLLEYAPGSVRQDVRNGRQERRLLTDLAVDKGIEKARYDDKSAVYVEQVRAVQAQAFLVEQLAREIQSDVRATRDYMELGRNRLTPDEVEHVRGELQTLERELNAIIEELQGTQTDVAVRQVMGVKAGAKDDIVGGDRQVMADYRALHDRYRRHRGQVSEPGSPEFFDRVDAVWSRLEKMDSLATRTARVLDEAEDAEVQRLGVTLGSQVTQVDGLAREVNSVILAADEAGTSATRSGFHELKLFFGDSVLRADMGIVDVYWARQMEIRDRIDDLNRERAGLEGDMRRRFETIKEKLEE